MGEMVCEERMCIEEGRNGMWVETSMEGEI